MLLRPLSSLALAFLAALPLVSALACSAGPKENNAATAGTAGSGAGSSGDAGFAGSGISGSAGSIADGGSGSTITESCGSSTFANQVPANILIVLDKSGSMAGGDGQPDKWAPTVDAVKAMMKGASPALGMGLLPFPEGKFDDSALVGCALNPSSPMCAAVFADGGCEDVAKDPVVAVGPIMDTQSQIAGWLDSNGPGGNTPTLSALRNGYAYMQAANLVGERYVLLMTDGVPTTHTPAMGFGGFMIPESNIKCEDLPAIEAEAAKAAAATPKVKTFVIGSPGSEGASDFLSQLAINGETKKSPNCSAGAGDCHYQIGKGNFEQDLQAALDEIAGKLSECVFEIPNGEDADPDYVNVALDSGGMKSQLYKDPEHVDGWDYTDDSHTKVELFGPACEKFKSEKDAQVSIILGCKTEVK